MKLQVETKQAIAAVRASKNKLDALIDFKMNPEDCDDTLGGPKVAVKELTVKEISRLAKLHIPRMGEFCLLAINELVTETLLHGHSPELDQLKNEVYFAWGKFDGKDLS